MPEKFIRTTYVDDNEDDADDAKIYVEPESKRKVATFVPSDRARLDKLQLMRPPSEMSVVASRVLGKEFTALIKLQDEGKLPFYVNQEVESLYRWVLELFDFPASKLKEDMSKYGSGPSNCVADESAEIRFPASFPHSPPFMRMHRRRGEHHCVSPLGN
jgi:ubiquitin-conjugating enzyme E2 Q